MLRLFSEEIPCVLNLSGWVQNPGNKSDLTVGQYADANGTIQLTNEGWRRSENNLAAFTHDYGRFERYEDWSTVWELYFRNTGSVTTIDTNGNAVLSQKLQAVGGLFHKHDELELKKRPPLSRVIERRSHRWRGQRMCQTTCRIKGIDCI